MARIRTIKPEFWTDEKLSELPESVHILAAALLNYADDHGYFNANPKLVKAACFPLREPSVSIHEALMQLVHIDYIRLADGTDGRRYGWIVGFTKHQRVNRPSDSRISTLVQHRNSSVSIHGGLTESSVPEQGTGNREEEQGKEEIPSADAEGEPAKAKPVYSAAFERWYAIYPRKVGKQEAASAFGRAIAKIAASRGITNANALDVLCSVTLDFAKSPAGQSGKFTPHPATWLNAGRYDDDQSEWKDNGKPKQRTLAIGAGQRFDPEADVGAGF